jgi:hypothetical protein
MAPPKKAAKKKAAVKQGVAVKNAPANVPVACPSMKQSLADALRHTDELLGSSGMTRDVIRHTRQLKNLLIKAQRHIDKNRILGKCQDDLPKPK